MKYMNMKKRLLPLNLQLFAEGEDGSDGDDAGGDDQDDEESDKDGDDEAAEKKYTEKEMEDAVQKRLEREKRKWRRAQKQVKSGGKNSGNNASGKENDGEEDEETRELRDKAAKAEDLELKWTCLEHDVDKSCVDDVLALAKVHMAKNDDMDIEDAIDEVLKKYPQFKVASEGGDDDPEDRKSWGQRHNKPSKKAETVEDAIRNQLFGKLNNTPFLAGHSTIAGGFLFSRSVFRISEKLHIKNLPLANKKTDRLRTNATDLILTYDVLFNYIYYFIF